jgi:hypothetical protein
MRYRRLLAPPLLLLALAQCRGDLSPFETTPVTLDKAQVKAISIGDAAPTTIGVCYNSFAATAAEVRAIAATACGADTVPRPVERDFQLSTCPLLQPARATFVCLPKTP